jgi:hypothetical protein
MVPDRVFALVGRVIGAVFAGITLVRRPRPIHARGVRLQGTATWTERSESGVRWIDDAPDAPQRVTARASRSIGFPAPAPDIVGLALRFETEDGVADIELASTGVGVPGRFILRLHGSPSRAHLGTLLPYVGERGPVLLAARTISPGDLPVEPSSLAARLTEDTWHLRLYVATPRGRWHPFADLELQARAGGIDTPLRFDAGRRLLPGSGMPEWVRAVRQPAYDFVQRPTAVRRSAACGSPR